MTWTYGHNPTASTRDGVRFLVGDTDEDEQLVQDEVIAWALTLHSDDINASAVDVARGIAAKFASEATKLQIGRVREEYTDRAAAFAARATEIETNSSVSAAGPVAPQISLSDRETAFEDTDRADTQFKLGQMDNLRTGPRSRT